MRNIKILPESVTNKIAAGEVVERPLSVVKELVENSIDAGASEISISVEKGGRKSVVITDNGGGMTRDDMFLCVERHATSKLREEKDLEAVKTMGFRGEALSSISAVSRFCIESAVENGEGHRLCIKGGEFSKEEAVPLSKGTKVSVNSIFYNVPVRRKFLKSEKQEFSLISRLVRQYSMVNPRIAFSLSHNGRKLFFSTPGESVMNRIRNIWGLEPSAVHKFHNQKNEISVSVFISSPLENCYGPSVVSVNDRIVHDRRINGVVFRVLRNVTGKDARTAHALFISLPCEKVDVNVHPAKQDVRFSEEKKVFGLIEKSIRRCFSKETEEVDKHANVMESYDSKDFNKKTESVFPVHKKSKSRSFHVHEPPLSLFDEPEKQLPENREIFGSEDEYRIVGTVLDVYIIVEKNDNVYFIDQHASHERIVYSNLMEAIKDRSGMTQTLLSPDSVVLDENLIDVFKKHSELFKKMGFFMEVFDESSLILRGVPAMGFETRWTDLIKDMLSELEDYGTAFSWDENFLGFVATKACHNAVRGDNKLSSSEIKQLLKDIEKETIMTCPHGRPFYFTISRKEFKKRVKRS